VEILVADNGSTDDSAAVATRSGARVLHLPNLRVSELRNQATSATTSDLFAFVDGRSRSGAALESPPRST
jgi:glycosyltransferase involved in cell wall biosynthesis